MSMASQRLIWVDLEVRYLKKALISILQLNLLSFNTVDITENEIRRIQSCCKRNLNRFEIKLKPVAVEQTVM